MSDLILSCQIVSDLVNFGSKLGNTFINTFINKIDINSFILFI